MENNMKYVCFWDFYRNYSTKMTIKELVFKSRILMKILNLRIYHTIKVCVGFKS